MGVNTKILWGDDDSTDDTREMRSRRRRRCPKPAVCWIPPLSPETVLGAVEREEFLILPHTEVLDMYRMKGSDYDRWLSGMRRYQAKLRAIADSA